MSDRNTFKTVAKAKLKAAKILYKAKDYSNAGYLLGYVLEAALKACICKRLRLSQYPDSGRHHDVFSTHNFDRLLILSGFSEHVDFMPNQNLLENWSTLTHDWRPSIRYNKFTN